MRVLKVPQTGAKKKLLDAAEGLVAEKGFDLVSVRDITGAVKANVAAVNYHFGSREGLMDLVIMRTLEPLCEVRISSLLDLPRNEGAASVEEIISSYVNSLAIAAKNIGMDQALFLRLAGRILVLPEKALAPSLAFSLHEVREKYLEALRGALKGLPSEEILTAWDFFESGISQSLLSDEPTPESWIRIGMRCLGGGSETTIKTPKAKTEEAHENVAETGAPAEPQETKAARKKSKTPEDKDKQELLFDF